MANGEVERSHVHGFLNEKSKPKRKRPKVGDKDPDWKPKKKKPRKKSPPPNKKKKKDDKPTYTHRDYRGTRGAIDDAEGVKRK